MKKNFNTVIKNIDGNDILETADKPLTVRAACLMALLSTQEGDDRLDGQKKFSLVELAFKIRDPEEVDISSEDIVLLKQRVAKVPFTTHVILYRIYQFLEDKE